jgi:hypothetical protein
MLGVALASRCLFAAESLPSGLRSHDWGDTAVETGPDGVFNLRLDVRAWPTNGVIRVYGVTNAPERVIARDESGRALRWLQSDVWVQVMAPDPSFRPSVVDIGFSRDPGLIRLNALPNDKHLIEFEGPILLPAGAPAVRLLTWLRQPGRYRVDVDVVAPPKKDNPVRMRIAGREFELNPAGTPATTVDLPVSGLLVLELECPAQKGPAREIRSLLLSPAPVRKAP